MRHTPAVHDPEAAEPAEPAEPDFEVLLEYLKRNRGFDFTGYKRASLARRILKRMQTVSVPTFTDYVDFLEVHPEEFAALFNTILINVTSFFRDASAWDVLARRFLPDLVARKGPGGAIRVWSAGCASGEEAYTLAMLLAEQLGPERFHEQVKIYATDIDEEALTKARSAVYTEREVVGVPAALLEKYFDAADDHYTFRKDYRRQVIFGRHDLIQDAPISRVDLLACRNALMYFNAETQSKILARFHFALNDGGILFLGRAETLLTHTATFTPIDLKHRISTKIPRGSLDLRDRLLLTSHNGVDDGANGFAQRIRLREVALDSGPVAQLVLDAKGVLVLANDRARGLFSLGLDDIGRPIQDLRVSYRPVELRTLLEQVSVERRVVTVQDVDWPSPTGEPRWFDLQITPLVDQGTQLLGASVAFMDVTAPKRLQHELERTTQELEAAYEELQSTNEELETTNEELQSTMEELQATNEELQATNEELETMNEELQSTNEELSTMNDELRLRGEELDRLNALLGSVLASLRGGVVVVDTDFRVLVWNERARDLWGLRSDEVVGRHFLGLDIGLPVERLMPPMRAALAGERDHTTMELDATNRRGQPIHCRIGFARLVSSDGQPRGVILVVDEIEPQSGPEKDG